MKCQELQIGDYVRLKRTKEIVWVFEIDGDRNVINNEPDGCCSEKNIAVDDVEPILLTPEILKLNGFEQKNDGWLRCEDKANEFQNYIFIQYRNQGDIRECEINYVNIVKANYLYVINYVHELQHLLRSCGVEESLTI